MLLENLLEHLKKKTMYKIIFLALHFAATKGHASVVELLINDKEANNINSKTAEGFTPLYRAARYGREAVVKLLVNKGTLVKILVKSLVLSKFLKSFLYNKVQLESGFNHTHIIDKQIMSLKFSFS